MLNKEKREESKNMGQGKKQAQEKTHLELEAKIGIIRSKVNMTDVVTEKVNKLFEACLLKMVVFLFKEEQEKVEADY